MRKIGQLFLLLCLWALPLEGVEIREPESGLSGRLSGMDDIDAVFGDPVWRGLHGFRPNDFLVGSVSSEMKIEVTTVLGFRVDDAFVQELKDKNQAYFIFTLIAQNEGNVEKILPLKVYGLKSNAVSAKDAAESPPEELLGEVTVEQFKMNHIYRFPIPNPSELQAGDLVWIGLNGTNPRDGKNHNLVVGGDLITFPGSVPPMLIAGETDALTETIEGISFLTSLHRKIRAPAEPSALPDTSSPSQWLINPVSAKGQLKDLEAVYRILQRELGKQPRVRKYLREEALGFHSSIKPSDEGWKLTLPVDGIASALCLLPVLKLQDDQILPVNFPKRFVIRGRLKRSAGEFIVADWTEQDFPLYGSSPVVFSFPWEILKDIEIEIFKGADASDGRHFFALEEIFLYRPSDSQKTEVVVPEGDSFEMGPRWSRDYLTDSRSSLGPTLTSIEQHPSEPEHQFPDGLQQPLDIVLDLKRRSPVDIWSLDLYPVISPDHPELLSPGFPEEFTIDFSNNANFSSLTFSREISISPNDLPRGFQPVHLTFPNVPARFIRIRIRELLSRSPVAQLGLTEIRFNGGVGLVNAQCSLQGGTLRADGKYLIDDVNNGFRLNDPLPGMIGLVRRDVVKGELRRISERMALIKEARQRTIRLIASGIVALLFLLLIVVYLWQRRRRIAETFRIRSQIQQDLHDEIGSSLSTISLVSSHMLDREVDESCQGELADINLCAREATASLREVIWMTDKKILTLDKCVTYMKLRAEHMVRDCRLEVEIPTPSPALPIPSDFKRNLFLLYTEAIHNARKHAKPSVISILLKYSHSYLEIEVRDDGEGFDPDSAKKGIGTRSMQERAKYLNGIFELQSRPGSGTCVYLKVKIPQV